ncbi:restriction endonuclease subunit S [Pseudomonas wadenswilerensis]|uniref:restriction endonuclease subunit S n=1 Tax=Pseudomonas wadenswilerensis TaxID=1785161 RepID=UPI00320B9491
MTALLTDNVPLIAVTTNGIKKLRELILELAVRGKLVPQDPNDEPASELLKRTQVEKQRLLADSKIRKQKELTADALPPPPYCAPPGWEWESLDSVLIVTGGVTLGRKPTGRKLVSKPYLRVANVQRGYLVLDQIKEVEIPDDEIKKYLLLKGDLLITEGGDWDKVGRTAIWRDEVAECLHQNHVFRARAVTTEWEPRWAEMYLNSGAAREYFAGSSKQTTNLASINMTQLRACAFPVPPLAEQHRIITKTDELMALCDRLETQQTEAESAHVQLVQAMLDSLTQAIDAADFAASWQRLAEHFHTLFTNEFAIDALKKILLQLAVMGKLVPQDRTDESASELLKRIEGEKQRLVDEGLMKKQKPLVESTSGQIKPALPSSWKWVPLLDITTGMDSGWSPACLGNSAPSDDVWGVLKTTAVQAMSYLQHENKELPSHLEPRPEAETKVGDILFTRAGPMNRVGISCLVESTRPKLMISDKIIRFHPIELGVYGRFIALCLNVGETSKYLEQAKSGMAASQVNISQEKLRAAPIPLAPFLEQHRIVAKVDQLMHLCDMLKQQINLARNKQSELFNAIMAQV